MHVIVVGAGIGGLSTALSLSLASHQVTLLESSTSLAELGAGVQLTPNTTRHFASWGILPDILSISALPESFNVLDGRTSAVLGSVDFSHFTARYGGPYLVIHRADIHKILHEHCLKRGVTFHLGAKVVEYGVDAGTVKLADGRVFGADLIVAVDGIHSLARSFVAPKVQLQKSGWAAYRVMVDVAPLRDAGLEDIAVKHKCNCFVGDGCLVMSYKIRGEDRLNLVLGHRDDVETGGWSQEQFKEEIRRLFRDFGDVKNVLELALDGGYEISNWPVYMVPDLERWWKGKLVVMGDAVHAMPFYLSMGVSMAAEDAAAVTECLAVMEHIELDKALSVFEKVRKPRAERIRDASLNAGRVLHLSDGQDRLKRDRYLRNDVGGQGPVKGISIDEIEPYLLSERYGIIDGTIRDWCYGYDVIEDIRKTWKSR